MWQARVALNGVMAATAFAALGSFASPPSHAASDVREVVATYADIAHAGYEDSLITAKTLQAAVNKLVAEPNETNLKAAKVAWRAARVPYQQTEAYRFGNTIVDDWEGKVNAWPLDEGLIDYVAGDYGDQSEENDLYVANVIANPSLRIGGETIDVSTINKAVISKTLHEAGGVEGNVASGYHAVEFLLWGQDLQGSGPGAGTRPASDFDPSNCTGGSCERRVAYLRAATELLIDDLAWMVAQWASDGEARKMLLGGAGPVALNAIFTGLGSLSYGELAGERMKLGLLLHDPEEEHDCFSDNTHNSHYYDALGIQNVYLGRYKRIDGSTVSGPSVSDLVGARSPKVDDRVKAALSATMQTMTALVNRARTVEAYDQMIGEGNAEGNAIVEGAIRALIAQTKEFERAITVLDLRPIGFEGSDSLDNPASIQ